jgi:putative acetyltransferase
MSSPEEVREISVVAGDFADERVLTLLREHLAGMHGSSPPGSVYALGAAALQVPEISFFTAWRGQTLLGCAALKHLDATSGELKSFRTASAYLRQGVASHLLEHLLTLAHSRGYTRVSVETGSGPAFEPALALYRKRGFQNGSVFGDYVATDFNQFLHLAL